jgi:hypothetical protein
MTTANAIRDLHSQTRKSSGAAGMTGSDPHPGPAGPDDDAGGGLLMLFVFVTAVLTSTGAVALIALAGTWWMLGVGFAIHVAMTAAVVLTIVYVMASHRRSSASRARLPGAASSSITNSNQATIPGAPNNRQESAEARSDGAGGLLGRPRREAPDGQGSARKRRPRARRVLVLTDENLASANEVPEPILAHIEPTDDVYVVAPTLTTRLQSLTGEIDRARLSADDRLRTVFDHMYASGLESRGTVGDEDQVTAIADALDGFDADLILLRLHAPGSQDENWRERRLAKWVRAHTTVPTIVFYFDSEGHVVGREEAKAPVAIAA